MGLEAAKHRSAGILAFVDQAALDIRKKLQKVNGLAGESSCWKLRTRYTIIRDSWEKRECRLRVEGSVSPEKRRAIERGKDGGAGVVARERQAHGSVQTLLDVYVADTEERKR